MSPDRHLSTTTMTGVDNGGFTTDVTVTKVDSVEMVLTNAQLDFIYTYLLAFNGALSAFGMITNILNIIIFYKMGFALTTNYSFFVLAITDFFFVVHNFIAAILWYPLVNDLLFNFSWVSVMYFASPFTVSYSAFGSWVSTVISVERACCIVFPLKVTHMSGIIPRR